MSLSPSWIFAPKKLLVYGSKDGTEYDLLQTLTFPPTLEGAANSLEFLEATFPKTSLRFVKVVLEHFEGIPEWHPGKGTLPWLFVDEILIE